MDPNYQELNTITTNHSQHHHSSTGPGYLGAASSTYYPYQQNASTATRELDELMMSLSEFKVIFEIKLIFMVYVGQEKWIVLGHVLLTVRHCNTSMNE